MHAAGAEFLGEALRQRPEGEFAGREGGRQGRPFQRRRCSGEDEGRRVWEIGGLEEERERGLGEKEGASTR